MTCPHCATAYFVPVRLCPVCGTPSARAAGTAPPEAPRPVRTIGAVTAALLSLDAVAELVLTLLRGLGESTTPGLVLGIPAVVLTIPVFLVWFTRLRHNAGLWGAQRRSPGWAVWGWFVPVVNLWFPYQIAADASAPEQVGASDSRTTLALVRVWWVTWVLAAAAAFHVSGPRHPRLVFTPGGTVASSAFAAVSALVAMRVVRRLTAVQDARTSPPRRLLPPIGPVPPGEGMQPSDPAARRDRPE